jgi:hypothetical protein
VILDSNILIAIFQNEHPDWFEKLAGWQIAQTIHINLVIFAEVAPSFTETDALQSALAELGLQIAEITLDDAYRAGCAFAEYRRRGGSRETILPDFLIGAQAEMRGWPLVTRDRKGFASYFPNLEIIDPMEPPRD